MQRPNAAQLTYGSATVVLATVALLLSGTTTLPGIAAACAAGLLLGVLVAVTMPGRAGPVKTSAPVRSASGTSGTSGNEEIRVPAARVGGSAGTRIGS
ncbi:hypothetical protein GCM10010497_42210 [Streptomyces cinereoruber]|uniref:Secreted protein n=1 Tax=Streptomyces cinereoruber TaxID=67260 RepID=A0AAV4KLY9_9ACTN|nr:hypothetical protein [Streptomyces cinereoruber]MBB4156562.1 hypothetical protein [Streptomyces cinereoruber]MBY8815599.1 hypothetical protein [Streptomyces cinereoruber]NIH61365.1 hypothetical protein [Streptomyces cinereoruber]QEV32968.1 hypothetical protein CP977_13010 [Streptomyces cinereoruber]GGR35132.1 hypothetical protein GCM10010497_42210 [Streptomyces cinereoruber]